jgi:hypothetical protein
MMMKRLIGGILLAAGLWALPASAAASVKVGIANVAADTAGGDQTITSSTAIGIPSAAIFIVTRALTNGVEADGACMSVGFTDGIRDRVGMSHSEHGQAVTDTQKQCTNDECIMLYNAAGDAIEAEANFKNWETDGVTITWGNTPGEAYRILAIFFAGINNAYCGDFTSSSVDEGEVDVTDPGFEPDFVLFASASQPFDDAQDTTTRLSLGVANNDGATPYPQASQNWGENNGATKGVPTMWSRDDKIVQNWNPSTLARYGNVEIDSFDVDGFSSFTRDPAGNEIAYLAIKLTSDDSIGHWAGPIQSPTSTGNWSATDPGFKPQFLLLGVNGADTDDTVEVDGDAGLFFVSAIHADEQHCIGFVVEDASATTDTGSYIEDKAIEALAHVGASARWVGTFSSWNAEGWTINLTTCDGTSREWLGLAIEADAGATVLNYERGTPGVMRGVMRGAVP